MSDQVKLDEALFIRNVLVNRRFEDWTNETVKRVTYLMDHAEHEEHRILLSQLVENYREYKKSELECIYFGLLFLAISIVVFGANVFLCDDMLGSYRCHRF